jgi:hypothetical protein
VLSGGASSGDAELSACFLDQPGELSISISVPIADSLSSVVLRIVPQTVSETSTQDFHIEEGDPLSVVEPLVGLGTKADDEAEDCSNPLRAITASRSGLGARLLVPKSTTSGRVRDGLGPFEIVTAIEHCRCQGVPDIVIKFGAGNWCGSTRSRPVSISVLPKLRLGW